MDRSIYGDVISGKMLNNDGNMTDEEFALIWRVVIQICWNTCKSQDLWYTWKLAWKSGGENQKKRERLRANSGNGLLISLNKNYREYLKSL